MALRSLLQSRNWARVPKSPPLRLRASFLLLSLSSLRCLVPRQEQLGRHQSRLFFTLSALGASSGRSKFGRTPVPPRLSPPPLKIAGWQGRVSHPPPRAPSFLRLSSLPTCQTPASPPRPRRFLSPPPRQRAPKRVSQQSRPAATCRLHGLPWRAGRAGSDMEGVYR